MSRPRNTNDAHGQVLPVLIVGAGQAGLATAYHLKAKGISFRIIEAGARIGDQWRRRYRSLTLFTPRRFSALPGTAFPGDADSYAGREEFADYLDNYARRNALPVTLSTSVRQLSLAPDGRFEAALSNGERLSAGNVVLATGGFQLPIVPRISKGFDAAVLQLTADTYREPAQIPAGAVLVVGDGASGRDIAAELAMSHNVLLAVGKPRKLLPERILGKDIWWWLSLLGLMGVTAESMLGRLMRRADPFPDRDRSLASLRAKGVKTVGRLTDAGGATARFSDGSATEVATVVWAVGYRDDSAWVDVPGAVEASGQFAHRAGVSPVRGLFLVGRPWQRNRASGLMMGVGADAEVIANEIDRRLAAEPGTVFTNGKLQAPGFAASTGGTRLARSQA
jgi:putative flavoprotein involved in K+ transport